MAEGRQEERLGEHLAFEIQNKTGCYPEKEFLSFPYLPVSDELTPQLQENTKSRAWEAPF